MTDLAVLYGRGLDEFDRRIRQVAADQWSGPTPCAEWDVRALVNHVTVEQLWAPHLIAGSTMAEIGHRFDDDQLGADPVAAWASAAAGARAGFAAAGALLGQVELSYGVSAASHYCGEMLVDLTVHAWDLARAIGATEQLAEVLVGFASEWGEAGGSGLAASGYFAAAVRTPEDADPQSKMLGLFGRVA